MKKTVALLLILLILVFPAAVFAEGEEGQMPEGSETQEDITIDEIGDTTTEDGGGSEITSGNSQTEAELIGGSNAVVAYYYAEIIKVETITSAQDDSLTEYEVQQICQVELLSGPFRERVYEIVSNTNTNAPDVKIFKATDRVMVSAELTRDSSDVKNIYIYDYYRVDKLIYMAMIAVVLIFIIGFIAGARLVVTLIAFAAAYVFYFVPLMLKGVSPILLVIPICLVLVSFNIFSEMGFRKKALIALCGTFIAISISSLIGLYAESIAHLVGLGDTELTMMQYLPGHTSLNFTGLTFALSMLMSLGAAMNVNCTMCEDMMEAKEMNQYISRQNLYAYGMHSGRNVLSRALLSLFFAALVSVIPTWIVYAGYGIPIYELMNLNHIASQFFKIVASLAGVSISVPLTSLIFTYSFRSRTLY